MLKKLLSATLITVILYYGCTKKPTTPSASVQSLNCGSATFSSTFTNGVVANNVTANIPYASGNGGTYGVISIPSTGVTGLTATASAGSVANGNGTLILTINGTPTNFGTANFLVNFGGKTCTVSANVIQVTGGAVVTSLNCSSATITGTFTQNSVASIIPISIPYAGGNGGTYSAISISSTGVTGLTATASAGNIATGGGSLNLLVSGTPTSAGTANFLINLGGQTCTVSANVISVLGSSVVSSLNCSSSTLTGTITQNTTSTNIPLTIPYTGGNGGTYSAISVNSTGVTGLTATASAGSIATGSGNLNLLINGLASTFGTALFNITLGGKTCQVSVSIQKQPITISLLTNVWWKEKYNHYFNSNGQYYSNRALCGGTSFDTGYWSFGANDKLLINFTKVGWQCPKQDSFTIESLTTDTFKNKPLGPNSLQQMGSVLTK